MKNGFVFRLDLSYFVIESNGLISVFNALIFVGTRKLFS
jgi:hypothetical protein